jgi:integrase-like protein
VKFCVNDWQRSLSQLSELSGVKFHAHMLRDTFAVELLQKGVSLENVATLLGNSIKAAEKHYSPWTRKHARNILQPRSKRRGSCELWLVNRFFRRDQMVDNSHCRFFHMVPNCLAGRSFSVGPVRFV